MGTTMAAIWPPMCPPPPDAVMAVVAESADVAVMLVLCSPAASHEIDHKTGECATTGSVACRDGKWKWSGVGYGPGDIMLIAVYLSGFWGFGTA